MNVFFDIETIPTDSAYFIEKALERVKCPASIKKPESIAEWETNKRPALEAEAISKLGLHGKSGCIVSIASAFDYGPIDSVTGPDEKKIIEDFLNTVTEISNSERGRFPTLIGHNIIGFDLPFLKVRCLANEIEIPRWFPLDLKPWDNTVYDTMTRFGGARDYNSLDDICACLGIEGKGEIDGSMVWDLWKSNKLNEIAKYNKSDVELVRKVWRKMTAVGI